MIELSKYYKPLYKPGDRKIWTFGDVEFPMRWIPPGSFLMGNNERSYSSDLSEHEVTITKGFWIGETLVTEKQYALFTQQIVSILKLDLPKNHVDFLEAISFTKYLCGLEKMPSCSSFDVEEIYDNQVWRLPTEAEWEYACKTEKKTLDHKELKKIAWYENNSNYKLHPVGLKKANAWGLCDMLGNLWEWTMDNYHVNKSLENQFNPLIIKVDETTRVLKGGGYYSHAPSLYAANRASRKQNDGHQQVGFRLVRAK